MKKKLHRLLIVVFLLITGTVLFFLLRNPMNAEKKKDLKTKYNISFQDIKVKQCSTTMAQDIIDRLQFHVSDYHAFMDHFKGEICSCSEAEDGSHAKYICKPYPQREQRLTFKLTFQLSGSRYDAVLISYYE